jgi:hypothetical protein
MSRWIASPVFLVMVTMTGCDPQLNIAGAYFPAWLISAIGGLFCFWLMHLILLRTGMIPFLKPVSLVYLAIVVMLTSSIWLLFFAAR